MKVIGKIIFVGSLLLLASGCKSTMVEKITITPASLTVIKGDKTEFNVYITPSDPDRKSISCKVSDENVGKTSGILSNYVKGVDVGTAVVTCSDKYSGVVSNEMIVNVVLSEEEKNKIEAEAEKNKVIDDRPTTIITEIQNAMTENELNGSDLYGGKNFLITANIEEISSTLFKGNPLITFKQGNVLFNCAFNGDHVAFRNMRKGDQLTFTCTYDGLGIEAEFTGCYCSEEELARFWTPEE